MLIQRWIVCQSIGAQIYTLNRIKKMTLCHGNIIQFLSRVIINRIPGKSVSLKNSRALLLSSSCILRRNWYHVSYDTENYVSYDFKVDVWRRIAMKHNNIQVGTGSNLPAAQEKTCTLQLTPASNRMPIMRRVSNRWTQAENPGENHWTIGRYDFNLVRQISYFYEILARTYDRSYDRR